MKHAPAITRQYLWLIALSVAPTGLGCGDGDQSRSSITTGGRKSVGGATSNAGTKAAAGGGMAGNDSSSGAGTNNDAAGATGVDVNGGAAGLGVSGLGSGSSGGAVTTGGISGSSPTGIGGGDPNDPCFAPPAATPLVGWAAVPGNGIETTTGGGNVPPVVVTTFGQLQGQVTGNMPKVVYVKGVIPKGYLAIGSNKTIVGLCGAELHGHLQLSGSANVILRNIKVVGFGVGDCALDPNYDATVGCSSGDDAISITNNAHHVYIDHCDVSDGTDGNLDITNGSNYVTVSYTKFHYSPRIDPVGNDSTGSSGHRYSNLVGSTDTPTTYPDATTLNVTWHHNWWADNVMQRMPRVRWGKNHLYNNLYTSKGNSGCVRAGTHAQILIENSVFADVNNPQHFNNATDQATANITASPTDNLYLNTTGTTATGGDGPAFTSVPYPYELDLASTVQALVTAAAGPK